MPQRCRFSKCYNYMCVMRYDFQYSTSRRVLLAYVKALGKNVQEKGKDIHLTFCLCQFCIFYLKIVIGAQKEPLMSKTHNVSQEQPEEGDIKTEEKESFSVCPLHSSASLPCFVCQQKLWVKQRQDETKLLRVQLSFKTSTTSCKLLCVLDNPSIGISCQEQLSDLRRLLCHLPTTSSLALIFVPLGLKKLVY